MNHTFHRFFMQTITNKNFWIAYAIANIGKMKHILKCTQLSKL